MRDMRADHESSAPKLVMKTSFAHSDKKKKKKHRPACNTNNTISFRHLAVKWQNYKGSGFFSACCGKVKIDKRKIKTDFVKI